MIVTFKTIFSSINSKQDNYHGKKITPQECLDQILVNNKIFPFRNLIHKKIQFIQKCEVDEIKSRNSTFSTRTLEKATYELPNGWKNNNNKIFQIVLFDS